MKMASSVTLWKIEKSVVGQKGIADQQRFSPIHASLLARKKEKHLW